MSNAYFHPSNVEKRRSERVTHNVPVVVRGVDLLGQPFEERTSALVLNLHGCKYSSKHHVPKNSWITLEPSAIEKVGRVRARVVGIQRPPTPREYFQIAAEFEFPSNIWGMPAPEDGMSPMEMSEDRNVQAIADHHDASGARDEANVEPAQDRANSVARLQSLAGRLGKGAPGLESAYRLGRSRWRGRSTLALVAGMAEDTGVRAPRREDARPRGKQEP